MPLVESSLNQSLRDIFEGVPSYPLDAPEAGAKWASAYANYASTATAGGTLPVPLSLNGAKNTLASALSAGFTAAKEAAGPDGLATAAAALEAAFVAFWFAPPIQFAAIPPLVTGVVSTALPGLGIALSPIFAAGVVQKASAAQQASAVAAALHAWTKTVQVTTTGPSGPNPPVPLI